MTAPAVRAALETRLAALSPGFATAYENAPYSPVVGTPYQAVYILGAEPDNLEMNASYTERGILQINLFYPLDAGPGAAETRAKALRDGFPRGASYTASGVVTHIEKTPEIGPGRVEDAWYMKPVRVRFYSHIRSA